MNVYCLACGTEFAAEGTMPGEYGYPLHNGVCEPCRREARKPNHRLIAENERLRADVEAAYARGYRTGREQGFQEGVREQMERTGG